MYRARIIPCLLVRGNGLVKTRKFSDPVYVGDPVNAIRIFSEKEVDELIILDIDATNEKRDPNYDLIAEMAGEAFMPVAYGGGIHNISQIRRLIRSGIEKVVINTAATQSTDLITEAASIYGSQAIVVSVDIKKSFFGGYKVVSNSGTKETKLELDEYIQLLVKSGAGEIFLNSVDRDGVMEGYDLALLKRVSEKVRVPVIASGGAGKVEDFSLAINEGGASAVAAGSVFVFYGKHKAVLINYPTGIDI
jgi:cyclase